MPDPYPLERAHHSKQTVLIFLLALTSPPATVAAKTAITHIMMLGIIYKKLVPSGEYWRMLEDTG